MGSGCVSTGIGVGWRPFAKNTFLKAGTLGMNKNDGGSHEKEHPVRGAICAVNEDEEEDDDDDSGAAESVKGASFTLMPPCN